jgi:TatD DNase family protein
MEAESMIFETHGHYDDDRFDEDRDELLKSFPENDIRFVMNVGADRKSSEQSVALAHIYPHVYAAVGTHPNDVGTMTEQDIEAYRLMAAEDKVKAIGEIGLDYYYDDVPRDTQIYWFKRQLELAREVKLPVIIHSREAAKDTLDVMKDMKAEDIGGVVHCFSYSPEMALEYVKMGFYIGVGGAVTFTNAKKLVEVVKEISLNSIVLETDSPYLTPVPNRGKRNSALNIPYVAEKIADIKNIPVEEVYKATFENGKKLYRILSDIENL